MGIKRLFKKGFLGGGSLVRGHIIDALEKKVQTGKTFRECLSDSVKETVAEDLPGTSHIYQIGKKDGRKQGTIEQAERDEKKIKQIHEDHERDRKNWKEQQKRYEDLLDEVEQSLKE